MKSIPKGRLVVVSAPSGAGKTTLVRSLLQSGLNLEFSVSATSRKPRPGEQEGVDYRFLSPEEFRSGIVVGEFLEWEEVYPGQYYGTLKSEVERITSKGHHVIFDVDVRGGLNIKKLFGRRALSIFVMPPSVVHLEERLRGRSTDTEESILKRIRKAEWEMQFAGRFDRMIINDDLQRATNEIIAAVREFLDMDENGS
ncbi:MAG: guanylate kinase [Bacteroidales bacterium]|nr:guanylate kinase [Bacteroidales bacterium]